MGRDPGALAKAVDQAKAALAEGRTPDAQVVARFVLAKDHLRRAEADAASIVIDFMEQTGGDEARARSLAAACVLAIDAKSRELHEKYRERFLEQHRDDPRLFAFASFLLDRHHRYRLLRANHSRRERGSRGYIVNHGSEPMRETLPKFTLKTTDGNELVLPREKHDKLTLLLFVEPPADRQADFPVELDRRGKPTALDPIRRVMHYAQTLVDEHIHSDVEIVVAFVCDDAARVKDLTTRNKWTGQVAMVPDGLSNPMIRQLGVLSADKVPNVFLLRRDGTVAWRTSGLTYKSEFGFPYAFYLAMKVHIERCEVERGYAALAKGEYEQAARIFAGPFKPFRPDRFGWRSSRYHGQALAHEGAKNYAAALDAIEIAIDAHKLRHYRGRGPKDIAKWREQVADFTVKQPCEVFVMLWETKARILRKMNKPDLAAEISQLAKQPVQPDRPGTYGAFHEKLHKLKPSD